MSTQANKRYEHRIASETFENLLFSVFTCAAVTTVWNTEEQSDEAQS